MEGVRHLRVSTGLQPRVTVGVTEQSGRFGGDTAEAFACGGVRKLVIRSFRMYGARGSETFRWSEELWEPWTLALTGVPKRARRAAPIKAYVPAGLAERSLSLDATA